MFHKQNVEIFSCLIYFYLPLHMTGLLTEKNECNQPCDLGNFSDFVA